MTAKYPVPIQELSTYLSESLTKEMPDLVHRVEKLRVSSFPICALRMAYNKMEGIKEDKTTALKDWYTQLGTAAHTILQRYTASKKRIWGDWKCYNPACRHIVKFSNAKKCPKCKSEMEYVEFEVYAYKHLSGHIDGVYKDSNGKFWVIDYKTSSVHTIRSQKLFPTFPYAKNKAQIMAYCALIELMHDIKIEGWMLLYIARDKPTVFKVVGDRVSAKQKAFILNRCKLYDDQFEVLQNLKSWKDIQYLVDTKPCKSYDHYCANYKGFKGCPLEAVCFSSMLGSVLKDSFAEYKKRNKISVK